MTTLESDAGDRRAAGELGEEGIALVAQVLDANFAGEEAIGGKVAEKREELYGLDEGFLLLGILAKGDQVEDFRLLLRCAVESGLSIASGAGRVEPLQPAAKAFLKIRVLAGDQIDEFRSAGLDRAA